MSKVLRADQVPAEASGFSLADFEREARNLLERAGARATELIGQAQAQARAITEEARRSGREAGHSEGTRAGFEEGRRSGRQEGLDAARAETSTLAESLSAVLAELSARREALVKEAEHDLLALSMKIAERIVRRELAVDTSAAARAAMEAIGLAAERSRVTVRVNPADLDALRATQEELARKFADVEGVAVVGDEAIERGGCRVLTAAGEVDMQVDTQIRRICGLLAGDEEGGARK